MSEAPAVPDNPLARVLAASIGAYPTQKVPLAALWDAAIGSDRSLASSPTGRAEMAVALAELEASGVAVLPRDRGMFDRRSDPPLPTWVRRPPRPKPASPPTSVRIWPSQLQRAGTMATRPDELELLETVVAFLRAGGADRPMVPTRERSLELFGNEKRLDRLVASRLFTSGALSLELLRCQPIPMPFAAQWVAGASSSEIVLIVAENHHTYASLLRVAREQAEAGGPGRYVGYGGGQQFCSAVASVVLLEPRPTRIAYFGDLDLRGLQIPGAADLTARAAGLPPVAPALSLYRRLLEVGRAASTSTPPEVTVHAAADWLGPLAEQAIALLMSGKRLAQEAVGYDELHTSPQLIVGT